MTWTEKKLMVGQETTSVDRRKLGGTPRKVLIRLEFMGFLRMEPRRRPTDLPAEHGIARASP